MKLVKIKKFILFCGVGLTAVAACAYFIAETRPISAQTEDEFEEGDEEDLLGRHRGGIPVSVRVRDDTWGDVRVVSAVLEDRDIHLKNRPNVFGLKGTLNTRLPPGTYTVRWTVTKPAARGNRITLSFSKTFTVSRKKGGVTVTITGQRATVY